MQNEPFSFEVFPGKSASTRIVRLTGPLVLQGIFGLQAELAKEHPPLTIFDLAGVPYMDSAGMGVITNCYVSATNRGNKVIVAGTTKRVLDLFNITRVDTILPMAATVEEAEARS
ncbi:MAG: STAS domain-containing protein [Silvibacterium sp.]